MKSDKWSKVVQLHQYTKSLILLAEEHELEEWKTFLHPVLEQRDALNHICIAIGGEIDIPPNPKAGYIDDSLDKALAHLYRAFFDTADWIGIILREKIIEVVKPYDNECITAVAPEYYERIRPDLEQLNSNLAKLRNSKDECTDSSVMISQAENYTQKIEKLLKDYKLLIPKVPALEQFKSKQRKKTAKKIFWEIVIGIICAVVGIIGTYLLTRSGKL